MIGTDAAVVALVVVAFALVSRRARRWPVTMPIVTVAAGAATQAAGLVDLGLDGAALRVLGEVALAVVLFSDAVRIDVRALRRERGLPVRLLLVGLPLSIVLGTLVVLLLLPSLELWQAALLAAVLAPTDPALGQAVVEDEAVPVRIRQSLNVESGLNDGLALPAVLLFIALAGGRAGEQESWSAFFAQQVGVGLLLGALIGVLGALALRAASRAQWLDGLYGQLATLALAVLALTVTDELGGSGFVACFVSGLAFGAIGRQEATHLSEYTEDSGQLLTAVALFGFGNVLLAGALDGLTWQVVTAGLLLLTAVRMVPVLVSLVGSRTRWPTRFFLGWFGPRGLASIVFGLLLLEEQVPDGEVLFTVIAFTVLASVLAHGASAGIGAQRFGAWFERARVAADLAEAERVHEHRLRPSPTAGARAGSSRRPPV